MTVNKLPRVISAQTQDNTAIVELFVGDDIEYFKGHFDGHPLLPGVVQLDWVLHFFKAHLISNFQFKGCDVIKYQQPILPNMQVTLTMVWKSERSKLEFKYSSASGNHASGKIKVLPHEL
ncbi:3-hydroxyacyl-ACP dehydratase [Shewanella sp. WXL01]|uniref:ApeI family dehydratase n=1 Tax=Shewanella sp. WXL01 TaxID=2709721 RepID=UPI00143847CF|nr:3-hydroxyacyl-ACP dehydratase [Shewanella sp. WXL01]NKF49968.1 3-hydroxyacyl-ACP dehydratase [Shewanella sp. WXL01]